MRSLFCHKCQTFKGIEEFRVVSSTTRLDEYTYLCHECERIESLRTFSSRRVVLTDEVAVCKGCGGSGWAGDVICFMCNTLRVTGGT